MTFKKRIEKLSNRVNPPVYVFVLRTDGRNSFEYGTTKYNLSDAELMRFRDRNPDLFLFSEEHTNSPNNAETKEYL